MPYADQEQQRAYQREWKRKQRARYKARVIELLGPGCVRCGNDDVRLLELDHIVPIKRPSRGVSSGDEAWRKVATGAAPAADFQLLCANCHVLKTIEDRAGFDPGGRKRREA